VAVEVLNHNWLSIPHGSEHYTFTNMRKNNYEEALFKVLYLIETKIGRG
jgi:histone deacetylase complex regulatory component SIN3